MSVAINETNFPGYWFRIYVSNHFDLNGDGVLSDEELAEITSITFSPGSNNVYGRTLENNTLRGIEYFTNLESLSTSFLCVYDVSFNSLRKLKSLIISDYESGYELNLDLQNNLSLQSLTISGNTNEFTIKSILLSPSLQSIRCEWNYDGTDTVYSSNLENNNFTLDFSNCAMIQHVILKNCHCISISGLDNKSYLSEVRITSGTVELEELDFTNDSRLESVIIAETQLANLPVFTGCINLKVLRLCQDHLYGSLDVSDLENLVVLDVFNNYIYELLLGNKPLLRSFDLCTGTSIPIRKINVTNCPYLMHVLSNPGQYCIWSTSSWVVYSSNTHMAVSTYRSGFSTDYYSLDDFTYWPSWINGDESNLFFSYSPDKTTVVDVTKPDIVTQPTSLLCASGKNAEFSVVASSSKLVYQWQLSTNDGVSWSDILSATESTYSFLAIKEDSYTQYRCIVTNPAGSVESESASIIVLDSPSIVSQSDAVLPVGENKLAQLIVTATGDDPEYQWEVSSDSVEWTKIPENGTSSSYSFTASLEDDATYYRCTVSNQVGSDVSTPIEIAVVQTPSIIDSPPTSYIVATGDTVNIAVIATDRYLSYQWQASADNGSTWTDITQNGDSSNYSFTAVKSDSGKKYQCIVENAAGSVTSSVTTLTVYDPPVIISQSDNFIIVGENKPVNLSVTATGDNLSYQWETSSDNLNWTPVGFNGSSPSYSFTASLENDGTYYRCVASNRVGSVNSNPIELAVIQPPAITDDLSTSYVVATGDIANFSITVTGRYLSYKWQVSTDNGSTWTDISSATTSSYYFTAARSDWNKQYQCVVTNVAGSVTSRAATLRVYDPPIVSSWTYFSETVPEDTEITLSVTATGTNIDYQWQIKSPQSDWVDIQTENRPTYVFRAERSFNGKCFRCRVCNEIGTVFCDIYDPSVPGNNSAMPLVIIFKPVVSVAEETILARTGGTASLSVQVEGGLLTYQWQRKLPSDSDWTDILNNATTNPYSFTAAKSDAAYQYRCVVTNTAGTTNSTAITLTVLDPPVINSVFSIAEVVAGDPVILQADATGDELEYQWLSSINNSDWTDITENAANDTYSFTANVGQNWTYYRYQVINRVGSELSNSAQLIVISAPVITSQPQSQVAMVQRKASFSFGVQGEGLEYQWQVSTDNGANWTDIPDATTDTYEFYTVKGDSGNQYRCSATNIAGAVESDPVTLRVLFGPGVLTNPTFPERVSEGDYVYCDADVHGDEISYKWYVKYSGIDQWYPLDTENSDIYTDRVTYEQEPREENGNWFSGVKYVRLSFYATKDLSGNKYYCEFWNDVGRTQTQETNELYVLFMPEIKIVNAPDSAVRTGNPVSLSVVADGGDLIYQWQISVDNGASWQNVVDGGKASTYSFTATVSQNGYQYQCIVTNVVGSATCTPISLKVQAAPSISAGPVSQSVGLDTTATFTAAISGTDLVYQWQVSSDNGATWIDIGDTDAPSYSLTAGIEKDGHMYRCRASNDLGFVVTGSALLTVLSFPEIITQPSSATVEYASNVVFLVSATGGELAYQWEYSSDNGVTWTKITKNGTNATYSFLAVDSQNGFLYHCIVGNKLGTVVSEAVTLTVLGSATTEEEMPVLVFAGKYLPSQMAAMIRELPIGANLDEIAFGARAVETLHASIGRTGSTDPRYYEEIAESINELKSLIAQLQSQNPSS